MGGQELSTAMAAQQKESLGWSLPAPEAGCWGLCWWAGLAVRKNSWKQGERKYKQAETAGTYFPYVPHCIKHNDLQHLKATASLLPLKLHEK